MIIFDLVLATRRPQMTGIERYGLQLFIEMRRQQPDVHAFVSDASAFSDQTNVHVLPNALMGWLILPFALSRSDGGAPIVICPSFPASPLFRLTNHRLCRIIHDSFPWTRSTTIPVQGRVMFRQIENLMLSRYTHICAPTEQVRAELREALRFQNIFCCGNAPGLDLTNPGEMAVSFLKQRRYVLAVGTVEPRKNYEKFVAIARSCTDHGLLFVAAGRAGWGPSSEMLKQAEAETENIVWIRDTSDNELRWLYRNCDVFLSTSHAEGFNMPLVEAGMSGCKIICSDIPIHRDVAPPWADFIALSMEDSEAATRLTLSAAPSSAIDVAAYQGRYGWSHVAARIEQILHG